MSEATHNEPQRNNPYVGPRRFESEERRSFFGRDREREILSGLVLSRRAVLLFAQSGAGKSSLLRAALVPELEGAGSGEDDDPLATAPAMRVLSIATVGGRVPREAAIPIENHFVFSTLQSLDRSAPVEKLAATTLTDGLASHFPSGDTPTDDLPTLLVFDQFEELFTHHAERGDSREDFFRQVAAALACYPRLHVLFAMREDFLAELTPYAALLPDELRVRYRLERLGPAEALAAIQRPAARAEIPFAEGVAEELVKNLRRVRRGKAHVEGEHVEPVQLQIVCRRLWDGLPAGREHILAEDVRAAGDVDRALTDFYEQALAQALSDPDVQTADVREQELRDWFDNQLITPARTRGLVYRDESSTGGLANVAIERLEARYLIRVEIRGGERWYELVHDRLVEPIREANATWRADYPLVRDAAEWHKAGENPEYLYEAEPLEEARTLVAANPGQFAREVERFVAAGEATERERSRRKKFTAVAIGLIVLTLVLVGFAIAMSTLYVRANQAKKEVQEKELETQTLLKKFQAEQGRTEYLTAKPGRALVYLSEAYQGEKRISPFLVARAASLTIDPMLATLSGHVGEVSAAALSPDGSRVVTAGEDRTARLWDTASGKLLAMLTGHTQAVYQASFSPDGSKIVTAGLDNVVRVWDGKSGALRVSMDKSAGRILSLSFSPDGTRVVAACWDYRARVWDTTSGKLQTTLSGHTNVVNTAVFSPEGTQILTASWDKTAVLWNATSGKTEAQLKGHSGPVVSASFSSDGDRIVTASYDQSARIWRRSGAALLGMLDIQAGPLYLASFSPDGSRVLTIHKDQKARIWSQGGTLLATVEAQASDESLLATPIASFSPDGSRVLTGNAEGLARLWDGWSGSPIVTLVGHDRRLTSASFSRDGSRIVTASVDGTARLWSAAGGEMQGVVGNHKAPLLSAAFDAHDASQVLTAGNDGSVTRWDWKNGHVLRTFKGHAASIRFASFSGDGSRVVTGSDDGTEQVWDATTGTTLFRQYDGGCLWEFAIFNSNASQVVAGCPGIIQFWAVPSGELLGTLVGGSPHAAAFNPEGSWLVIAIDDKLTMWDAKTRNQLGPFHAEVGAIDSVSFRGDGSRVVAAGEDGKARIWGVPSGDLLAVLEGHRGRVNSATFSPNGSRVVTAGSDGTIRIWDSDSGKALAIFEGHGGAVSSARFDRQGIRVVSAGADGLARLWDVHDETRTPAEIDRLVKCKLPLHLKNDQVLPTPPDLSACSKTR